MLRFTRSLHSAAARQLHHNPCTATASPALFSASAASASHATSSSCAAVAARLGSSSSSVRLLHTVRAHRSDDVPDHKALKAAHQERMRIKREAEAEAKRLADLANPPPPTDDPAADPATATTAADPAATPSSSSTDASFGPGASTAAGESAPTQSQMNKLWSLLRREVHHLQEHMSARAAAKGPAKREKTRPVVAKSSIPLKAWSQDPVELAAAKAAKDAAKDAKDDAAAEAVPEYTGSTALQAVNVETTWDRRINSMKEQMRFVGVAVPKKLVRSVTAKSETLGKLQEDLSEHAEEVKERWETSQDPRVHKWRDLVEKVTGESETGMALGEIMSADPHWNYLDFLKEMEEVMIPEVIQAFRLGDMVLLKSVTEGDASRSMLASFQQRETQKVDWDPRILDIRGVDVVKASLHEDVPFIHLTFVCQHVAVEFDAKSGEMKDPSLQSVVQNTYYSWAIKRDYESPHYDWKIFEFQYQHIAALI